MRCSLYSPYPKSYRTPVNPKPKATKETTPFFGHRLKPRENTNCTISFISVVAGLLLGPQVGYLLIQQGVPVLISHQKTDPPASKQHNESHHDSLHDPEATTLEKMVAHNELERNFSWVHSVSDALVGAGTFHGLSWLNNLLSKKNKTRSRKTRGQAIKTLK